MVTVFSAVVDPQETLRTGFQRGDQPLLIGPVSGEQVKGGMPLHGALYNYWGQQKADPFFCCALVTRL